LLQNHLGVTFKQVQTQVKEALHLRMRHALVVFRSYYQKTDLEALSEGNVDIPEEELDAIDEDVLEIAKILVAKFKEEVIPLPLDL
jgi:hypothetical protein